MFYTWDVGGTIGNKKKTKENPNKYNKVPAALLRQWFQQCFVVKIEVIWFIYSLFVWLQTWHILLTMLYSIVFHLFGSFVSVYLSLQLLQKGSETSRNATESSTTQEQTGIVILNVNTFRPRLDEVPSIKNLQLLLTLFRTATMMWEANAPFFPTKHDITEIYCHVFAFSATVGGKFPGLSFSSAQKVHLMQVLGTFRGSQQCWWSWLVTQIYSNNTRVTTRHKSKTKAVPLLSFLSVPQLH